MKKPLLTLIIAFSILIILLLTLNLISAINLDISTIPITDTIITDLNNPTTFELNIKNLEDPDDFEIYSVVGLNINPEQAFHIDKNKKITIQITLQDSLKSKQGLNSFEYKIRNSKNEIQREMITLKLLKLEESFSIIPETINPKSETITINIKNLAKIDFNKISLNLESTFFNYNEEISLTKSETKEIEIPIQKDEIKSLSAGNYIAKANIGIDNIKKTKEFLINFIEQVDIQTIENKEGILILRKEIIKKNIGNVQKLVEITQEKNILEYFFTTSNDKYSDIEFKGLRVKYTWTKELIPGDQLKIILKTNWFFPVIIIILILISIYFIRKSVHSNLIIRKKVSFVKTKGGQFALKVSLKLKAKTFIQKIKVIDKLPHLVKLYPKFGVIAPDNIDEKNRRLEWNVESLNKDEERIFTYIIYSKVGVVGRFELPSSHATYEKEGKIKEAESNRSFFINEQDN